MVNKIWIVGLVLLVFIAACQSNQMSSQMPSMSTIEHSKMTTNEDTEPDDNIEFEKLCKDRTPDNWMSMRPMVDGEFTSDVSCWGCMSDDGMNHYCNMEEYKKYLKN